MLDDPANWSTASETPDFATALDSFEDICRQTIIEEWPGRQTPDAKSVERVMVFVRKCVSAAGEYGLLPGDKASRKEEQAIVVKVLGLISDAENPKLIVRCLRFVFNLESSSQTVIADEFGLTRAAVSRVCVALCDHFSIVPGRGMKSEEAREVYRERATNIHTLPPTSAPIKYRLNIRYEPFAA